MNLTRREAEALGLVPRFNPHASESSDPLPSASSLRIVTDPEERRPICLACEHLINGLRCGNLNCGCPKNANRIEPWKNLPKCARWLRKS